MSQFALIPLFAAFVNVALAFYVITRNTRSILNQVFFAWGIALGVWNIGAFYLFQINTAAEAIIWARITQMGVIFLPVIFLHLSLLITHFQIKKVIRIVYAITALFALSDLTPFFVKNVRNVGYGWFAVAGPGFWAFASIFFPVVVFPALFLLILKVRSCAHNERSRFLTIAIASAMLVFFGTHDLLPVLGFDNYPFTTLRVYPWGTFSASLYGVLVGYGVLHGQVLSMKALQTPFELRHFQGIQKFEVKILTTGGTITILSAAVLGIVGNRLGNPWLLLGAPACGIAFVGLMVWTVTQQRISDPRQLGLILLSYGAILSISLLVLIGATRYSPLPISVTITASGIVCFLIVVYGTEWVHGNVYDAPREKDLALRKQMLSLTELQEPELVKVKARRYILDWSRAEQVQIVDQSKWDGNQKCGEIDFSQIATFLEGCSRWATPTSVLSHKNSTAAQALAGYLQINALHFLTISSPRFGEQPVMLALGERRPKKAYSHIEASVLSDCCQILGAAVSRANLVIRARQSERLAISGMVNATLAHEIRNALSSIRTFSEAVESGSTTPADLEALASATTDQVTRAEQMLSQMLLAVSPTNATRELIDVNLSVKRSIAAVAGKIRKAGIFLNLRLNPEPLFALAHTGLDNCVINLLGNAIDATQEYPDREPRIEVSTAKQDNSVQILVADNGPGIPESIRARLFEPFATTKSKGTGLGLMFSRKLVESLDGTLTIETVDRPGATFAIRLPIPITID